MCPIEAWLAEAPDFCKRTGRPLVTLSYAQSLDGSLAARRGEPLTLSGEGAMRMTHALRAAHDAILVGIGTVLADDPRLTVRLVEGPQPQPIVLDSQLRMPLDSRLFEHPKGLWIAAGQNASKERKTALCAKGAKIYEFPLDTDGRVDPIYLLKELPALGIHSLMVEGGTNVIASFLHHGLVDQVVITIAPRLVGGLHLELQKRQEDWNFPLTDVGYARLGEDLIVYGRPSRGE